MEANMKLEDVLQERGLVNEEQVAAATAEAARTNTPTAFVLISQGFVSEQDVYDAQRAQASAGTAVAQPVVSAAPGVPPTNVAAELQAPVTPGVPSAPTTPTEALNDGPASPPPPPFSPLTANLAPATTAVAPTKPAGNGHAPESRAR